MQLESDSLFTQTDSDGRSRANNRLSIFSDAARFTSLLIALGTLGYFFVVLMWGLQRSFDIQDEGFYLLSSQNPIAMPLVTSFAYFLAAVPAYTVSRILDLRYAQVFAQLLGAILLSIGYLKWLCSIKLVTGKLEYAVAMTFSLIGNLLLFAIFPFCLSYNSITGLLLFASIGLLLYGTAPEHERGKYLQNSGFLMVLAGALCGFCLFIKFSAFVVFVPCVILLLAILAKRQSIKLLALFISGNCLACVSYFSFFQSPSLWWSGLSFWLQYQTSRGTAHGFLMQTYFDSIKNAGNYYGLFLEIALPTAFFVFFLIAKLQHRLSEKNWKILALILHLVLWLAVFLGLDHLHGLRHNYDTCNIFYIIALTILSQLIGLQLGFFKRKEAHDFSWSQFAINSSLAALPFVCAVGTSNPLLFQSRIYLSATFLFLFGLACVVSRLLKTKIPILSTVLITSIFAFFQFRDGFTRHPYGQQEPLYKQTFSTQLPNLKGVLLSESEARFLDRIYVILRENGFQPDDTILAFYNLPGVVYAMGGRSQGLAWYMQQKIYRDFIDHYLSKIVVNKGDRLFLITGWRLSENIVGDLHQAGVDFPQDFKHIGTVYTPIKVGCLDGRRDDDYMNERLEIYSLSKTMPADLLQGKH